MLKCRHSTERIKMGRYEDRVKGYMAAELDSDKLVALAKRYYEVVYGMTEEDFKGYSVEPLVLVLINKPDVYGDAKFAIICGEGVGWEDDSYNLLTIPVSVGFASEGKVELSVDVVQSCLKGTYIDLADFVRVFGDRLETNLRIWQNATEGIDQTKIANKGYPLNKEDN
jgi:hypothetical protein